MKYVSIGTNELSCISVEGAGAGGGEGEDGLSVMSSYGPTAPLSPPMTNVSAAHTTLVKCPQPRFDIAEFFKLPN